MQYKDYYKIMGLSRDTSQDEIKRAYRKLARKYHPDVSKEKDAEAKFKELGEAYEVLKDPEKRAAYDQLGANWKPDKILGHRQTGMKVSNLEVPVLLAMRPVSTVIFLNNYLAGQDFIQATGDHTASMREDRTVMQKSTLPGRQLSRVNT